MNARESQPSFKPITLHDGETATLKEAAALVSVSPETVRRWCRRYGIGQQIEPNAAWKISKPALFMVFACDVEALEALRSGDREGPRVKTYIDGSPTPGAAA